MPGGVNLPAEQLVRIAWETGIGLPQLKLNALEMEIFERQISLPPHGRLFELLARRSGKTWGLLVLIEYIARTTKKAVMRYAAPTKNQAREIVIPNWQIIQEDCPPELRPIDRTGQEGCYVWPVTGSRLYLAGTDDTDQIDRLRGPFAHLIVVDELGFHHCNLRRLINGVLAPQLATTKGRMIMCTTPPETMDHPARGLIDTARKRGYIIEKTIWDNPMLDNEGRMAQCRECNPQATDEEVELIFKGAMRGSPEWHREWLCELVTDDNLRVVREFDPRRHVFDVPMPQYYTPYTFIDLAFARDNCAAVFCYLDFTNSRMVIMDEWVGRAKVLSEVKAAVQARELALWGDRRVLRYGDGSALGQGILATLSSDFDMEVLPCTMAASKEVMINSLREYVGANRIVIHPRCSNLINQLKDGIWKPSTPTSGAKSDYLRSETLGHLDALDALVYGVRSVDWHHNPVPLGKINHYETYVATTVPDKYLTDQQMNVKKMFRHAWSGRN